MILGLLDDAGFQQYLTEGYNYEGLSGNDEILSRHWHTFFQSFNKLGYKEVNSRNDALLRLLKENGVTYNIYGDPKGLNRPWELDLLPYIISEKEWHLMETGLTQRAELFNLILKDIYGEQQLIKNGLLPMELVYRHPGFLRECVGINLPHKSNLVLYAADMAKSNDGKIWIVTDRTQAPSGSGYAWENRAAMIRILPELFNGLTVRHQQPYFTALSNALSNMAPHNNHHPRIVILTPGPNNETYFEHSYMASLLGYTLVQGNDLLVKDNYVWLKTLEGLEKVDVIMRRVDDIFCDPLELKNDSQLGVPGLLQAVRSGNVSIANPLGSSVLENPGFMPFLENICRYYFDTDLVMHNIASWWCGQPKELKYVLDNLSSLVVKRIYRETGAPTSTDGSELSSKELEALALRIKADPQLYVGQEKVGITPVPSLVDGKILSRNTLFRSFMVNNSNEYTLLAGGLSRTSAEEGNFVISNQLGGLSKDTWVIGTEPERTIVGSVSEPSIEDLEYATPVLPSHTAENLYWVGRYTERVLGNARFFRTVVQYITEGNRLQAKNNIETERRLLKALTQYTYTHPGFAKSIRLMEKPLPELKDVLLNENRAGSLKYNYQFFKNTVYAVREHWSTDAWRLLRGMEELWQNIPDTENVNLGMIDPLNQLITSMMAFMGLNRESISREQGWLILDAGRKIEYSLLLINMIMSMLVTRYKDEIEYNLQEAFLVSNESLVSYRYKYKAHIQLPLVLELMLFDANNPRSLAYQLERLHVSIYSLPDKVEEGDLAEHKKLLLELQELMEMAHKAQLTSIEANKKKYKRLEAFLTEAGDLLQTINNAISKRYFKHQQKQQQLFLAE
ncbi:circularly permuted type 2 ATP-grasp protein [Ferruginibacter albus]|uniref:circularly permuted type 2 ATP-grasp protein n=1 Tax=Ferruginibacter albus TaxID=2875540 RepID=UPI001CC66FA9|nr:circularly permuted type 2 ATP-grasp protein [Ferruginibacter albus]UAY51306.1 circularly permuted type 2 ATP-grasp protein [Ferruginibacter albus]